MTQANTDAAVAFLQMAAGGKVRQAYSKYVADGFIHHNPYFEGSAAALMAGMEENFRQFPQKSLEVKRTISEADLVAVYTHIRQFPGDLGHAVVHIFRFENGLIVEMWDVGQEVLQDSPNQYGMF
jgi:predicted SnoaL-like aldol condensation-catalyzing enzyme